jgi:hypothetical protein
LGAALVVYGCDYNHAKSGNVRRGHAYGFALCTWHHRRHSMLHQRLMQQAGDQSARQAALSGWAEVANG